MPDLLKRLKKERKQLEEHARKYILKKDAGIRKNTKFTKNTKPLRKPNGRTYPYADYMYWWSDQIFCGSVAEDSLVLYLGLGDDVIPDLIDDERDALDYYCGLWDDVLKKELPEVYWRCVAPERDAKPKTKQEREWLNSGLDFEETETK